MSTNLTTNGGNPIADNQNSLSVVGDGWWKSEFEQGSLLHPL
jgi:hypothetical protein